MVVQHNLRAMNANRMLGITNSGLSKSSEKLSSGYKVNRAADDAAGLSISEKMRKQIRGLTQASTNAEDGISAVQTAEGALTEVHDMLQRMNELAVKAANGTNSVSDRQTIQDEVEQLLTEIDRVAETTKFNELYLLKGQASKIDVYLSAKDAGLEGTLMNGATSATFMMDALKFGDKITIAGKVYSIGIPSDAGVTAASVAIQGAKAGELITIDGVQYTVTDGIENEDKNLLSISHIQGRISVQSTVLYNGTTYNVMKDDDNNGIADTNAAVVTTTRAYQMIQRELELANSVGANKSSASVLSVQMKATATVASTKVSTTGGTTGADTQVTTTTKAVFTIAMKGLSEVREQLNFSLHVGADADMTNKIGVSIDALDTKGLGIYGLNVKDDSGSAATYAIDAIADAVAHVSAQRSLLGAVQNRLEHTINNLDNVVENTTAAESTIRDTDMATEMVKFSNSNILAQAGQSMLAQSNQANQGVLSLLQ
ncbi:MAG: flagellar hook protein [Lachnospiraceae bacterium]|nr:flagellar hook protein [Lachnospiraceae bacterium]